jgi:hypothetical protein
LPTCRAPPLIGQTLHSSMAKIVRVANDLERIVLDVGGLDD